MDVYEATEELILKIQLNEAVPAMVDEGMARIDAIASIACMEVETVFKEVEPAKKAEGLSLWNAIVQSRCEERFSELRDVMPNTPRELINEDPDLETLNGIRRGIRRAMGRSYSDIENSRKRQRRGDKNWHKEL